MFINHDFSLLPRIRLRLSTSRSCFRSGTWSQPNVRWKREIVIFKLQKSIATEGEDISKKVGLPVKSTLSAKKRCYLYNICRCPYKPYWGYIINIMAKTEFWEWWGYYWFKFEGKCGGGGPYGKAVPVSKYLQFPSNLHSLPLFGFENSIAVSTRVVQLWIFESVLLVSNSMQKSWICFTELKERPRKIAWCSGELNISFRTYWGS